MIIENLVISGGGIKGIAFCGALKKLLQLEAQGEVVIKLRDICGVSIGSIVGLLFIIGYTPQEIEDCIIQLDTRQLKNVQLHNMVHYGLDTGKHVMQWLKDMLKRKVIDPNITMMSLFEKTGINFRAVATNLDKRCQVVFDKFSHPELQVLQAIRMSISIPFIFTMQKYDNQMYVDGCVLDNYPISLYKDQLDKTLGLCITAFDETGYDKIGVAIDTFEEYVNSVLKCLMERNERGYFSDIYKACTVFVYVKSVSGVNFNIGLDTKINLMREGYLAVQEFFISNTESAESAKQNSLVESSS